jgi:hypothetical protein
VESLEPLDRSWWNEKHFGSEVVGAIDRAYRFAGRVEGYYLYEPRAEASRRKSLLRREIPGPSTALAEQLALGLLAGDAH